MQGNKFQEYAYRYIIFGSYILAALVASLPISSFSSASSIIQSRFQLNTIQISLNTLIFPISHTVFAFPCGLLIDKYGIKISYYASAILIILGVWLRTLLSTSTSYICLLGSLLSAIGGIFILNTPNKLAIKWFRSQMVPFITFTAVLSHLVSMIISLSLPGVFINYKSSEKDIINFFEFQAIIITIPMVLLVVLIKQQPEHPPSYAAIAIQASKKPDYLETLKQLFSNPNYIKLTISMSLNFGVCIGFSALFEQDLVGIGYENSSQVISIFGFSGIIMGVISNIVYSLYLKKTRHYKIVLLIVVFGDFFGFIIWTFGLFQHFNSQFQLILINLIFSFNHLAIPSIYTMFSAQIIFPIDQAIAAGFMMAMNQLMGFAAGFLYANLLKGDRQMSKLTFYITGGSILLSCIISSSIEQNLQLQKIEQKFNQQQKYNKIQR